jgi:hypothetical protein
MPTAQQHTPSLHKCTQHSFQQVDTYEEGNWTVLWYVMQSRENLRTLNSSFVAVWFLQRNPTLSQPVCGGIISKSIAYAPTTGHTHGLWATDVGHDLM